MSEHEKERRLQVERLKKKAWFLFPKLLVVYFCPSCVCVALNNSLASLIAQLVKNLPAMHEARV